MANTQTGEIHIASLIVHVQPAGADAVADRIAHLAGADLVARDGGKLIVVLEADHDSALADTIAAVGALAGVLAATPVFHHWEETEETPSWT